MLIVIYKQPAPPSRHKQFDKQISIVPEETVIEIDEFWCWMIFLAVCIGAFT